MQIKITRFHFPPTMMAVTAETASVDEVVEKLTPSYKAGGTVKWLRVILQNILANFLKMLNVEVTGDAAIPLLNIYPRELKTCSPKIWHVDVYIPLFIITKNGSNGNCSSMRGVHKWDEANPCNRVLFTIQKNAVWCLWQHGRTLKTLS